MSERQPQGSVTAHRNSADRASLTTRANSVLAVDVRHELLQKKIAVAHRTVGGVDVKTPPALRRGDEEIAHLMLIAQIVQKCPAAAVEQRLFVVAEAVKKIQDRITPRRILGCARVVARGQVNAIVNASLQDLTIQRAAIDATLRGGRSGERQI